MQRTQNIQSSLENKRNLENFKTYYKTTVIKTEDTGPRICRPV